MIATQRATRVLERNVLAYRRLWWIFATGFAEPLLFLLSIGVGVGELVGDLEVGGRVVPYDKFVAPGLLAMSAMVGCAPRRDVQLLREVQVHEGLRRRCWPRRSGPRDLAARRGRVVAVTRRASTRPCFLLTMVVFGLVGVVVGGARRAGRGADRLRVRGRGARGNHVHAQLPRLRLRQPRDRAAVPVLGHVLPALAAIPPRSKRSSGSRRSTRVSCSNARWCSATCTGPCC